MLEPLDELPELPELPVLPESVELGDGVLPMPLLEPEDPDEPEVPDEPIEPPELDEPEEPVEPVDGVLDGDGVGTVPVSSTFLLQADRVSAAVRATEAIASVLNFEMNIKNSFKTMDRPNPGQNRMRPGETRKVPKIDEKITKKSIRQFTGRKVDTHKPTLNLPKASRIPHATPPRVLVGNDPVLQYCPPDWLQMLLSCSNGCQTACGATRRCKL